MIPKFQFRFKTPWPAAATNYFKSQMPNKTNKNKLNSEKGAVAILMTLLILSICLLIAFGASAIFVNEIKISSTVGRSAVAFYAAESASEAALYRIISQNDSDRYGIYIPAPVNPEDHGYLMNQIITNKFGTYIATSSVGWSQLGFTNNISALGIYSSTRRKVSVSW